MRDRIIKANIKIRNCPEDLEKYIVVRTIGKNLFVVIVDKS